MRTTYTYLQIAQKAVCDKEERTGLSKYILIHRISTNCCLLTCLHTQTLCSSHTIVLFSERPLPRAQFYSYFAHFAGTAETWRNQPHTPIPKGSCIGTHNKQADGPGGRHL